MGAYMGIRKARARALIEGGLVRVLPHGLVVRDRSWQLVLGAESVVLEPGAAPGSRPADAPIRPFHRLVIMHKPAGVVSERARGSESWCRNRGQRASAWVARFT